MITSPATCYIFTTLMKTIQTKERHMWHQFLSQTMADSVQEGTKFHYVEILLVSWNTSLILAYPTGGMFVLVFLLSFACDNRHSFSL